MARAPLTEGSRLRRLTQLRRNRGHRDVEEHVTREILGSGRVVHEPQQETVDPQVVARVEDLHRKPVAGGDALHEPFIGNVAVPAGVMGGTLESAKPFCILFLPRMSERT